MIKIPVGMIIKQIIDEKRLKAQDVANKLGVSRQSIYQSYAKQELSDGEMTRWSNALGIEKDELLKRWESAIAGSSNEETTDNSFGSNILIEIKRMIEEELREKNDQIRSLQEALKDAQALAKMALGKFEDVAASTTRILELTPTLVEKRA